MTVKQVETHLGSQAAADAYPRRAPKVGTHDGKPDDKPAVQPTGDPKNLNPETITYRSPDHILHNPNPDYIPYNVDIRYTGSGNILGPQYGATDYRA